MEKIISLFQSRRFWAAVAAMLVALLQELFGIDEQTANQIVVILLAWIVGDSINKTQ